VILAYAAEMEQYQMEGIVDHFECYPVNSTSGALVCGRLLATACRDKNQSLSPPQLYAPYCQHFIRRFAGTTWISPLGIADRLDKFMICIAQFQVVNHNGHAAGLEAPYEGEAASQFFASGFAGLNKQDGYVSQPDHKLRFSGGAKGVRLYEEEVNLLLQSFEMFIDQALTLHSQRSIATRPCQLGLALPL
jgi:hypothetical protein